MATADRGARAGVSTELLREPQRFDFFQTVRLLGFVARQLDLPTVGDDVPAEKEVVRFRALPSLSFPASPVAAMRSQTNDASRPAYDVSVSFFGLTGPNGVLPYHYTRLLLERSRQKDRSFEDFLNLFHQRLLAMFYRAWEKYRLPFAFERAELSPRNRQADTVTHLLYCLTGFGTTALRGRLEVADLAPVYYSGHFSHYPRSALALEGMLAEYFELPVTVLQLRGQWLYLDLEDQSELPGRLNVEGRYCGLGVSLIAGSRIWDIQSRFRVRLGPLTYEQFRRLLPPGDMLRPVVEMVRTYVGPEHDFDVQLVLLAKEAPWCQLGDAAHLGWNTWIRCEEFQEDVADTVFLVEDI
jgi:type VI secretion system protein ImpH